MKNHLLWSAGPAFFFFFFDAAKALYFKLQVEKEKRVFSVCSLEWWSSPKRWVQTFPKRDQTDSWPTTSQALLCWISLCWAEKKHHYLDDGNSNHMRIMSKYIVQGNLGTVYYGFVAFLTVVICPYIEMEKDCVNWIYQQLTWKNRLEILHTFKSSEV